MVQSLPKDKIFDLSKLKAVADDKSNVTKIMIYVFSRAENIVGKEKMLVTSIFSFSYNVFKRPFPQECQKLGLYGKGLTLYTAKKILDWFKSKHLKRTK